MSIKTHRIKKKLESFMSHGILEKNNTYFRSFLPLKLLVLSNQE